MDPNSVRSATIRGFAAGSFGLSFFGLAVFWWFPFGLFLSFAGLLLALICTAFGIRGGREGAPISYSTLALAFAALSTILTLARGVPLIMSQLW